MLELTFEDHLLTFGNHPLTFEDHPLTAGSITLDEMEEVVGILYNLDGCEKVLIIITITVNIAITITQGGITCGAIDEPRKSSKAVDERVIINFRDKNVVIARFRDKNEVFILFF